MSESKFKTMRHIETVRNYLDHVAGLITERGREHDQSKLQTPEAEILEEYTPRLRGITYGSPEYRECMKGMRPMIEHHNKFNRHHPENHAAGIMGMNLIDLLEMLCDWKAAGMRHDDGDLYESLRINIERHKIPLELAVLLDNTIRDIVAPAPVLHHADES